MEGIAHILTSVSAGWCGWTMLGLLLCVIISEALQPGAVTGAWMIFQAQSSNRAYKAAPDNFMGQLLVAIFRIGSLAMALCLCFDTGASFTFVKFAIAFGVILVAFCIKMLCNQWMDYTFMLSRRFEDIYVQYGHIVTLLAIVLYIGSMILIHVSNPIAARWVLGIAVCLFELMLIYRSVQVFYSSLLSVLYLLLYIITLEALPLGAVWYVASLIISVL